MSSRFAVAWHWRPQPKPTVGTATSCFAVCYWRSGPAQVPRPVQNTSGIRVAKKACFYASQATKVSAHPPPYILHDALCQIDGKEHLVNNNTCNVLMPICCLCTVLNLAMIGSVQLGHQLQNFPKPGIARIIRTYTDHKSVQRNDNDNANVHGLSFTCCTACPVQHWHLKMWWTLPFPWSPPSAKQFADADWTSPVCKPFVMCMLYSYMVDGTLQNYL